MVFNLRWGILATGGIAETFVKDLLQDPTSRGVTDVSHTVAAVASSSSKSSAESFVRKLQIPEPCATYGSYAEAANDPTVQVVYVASPHSHHFQHTMLALEASKHVLCEKAFTVNAAQAKVLCETARKKGLFLMEAVWTRYFPLSIEVRHLVQTGAIGEVLRVISDLSIGNEPETSWSLDHRMVNKDLAGGALLDLGIYALTWVFQILYHTLPRSQRRAPSKITSHMAKYPGTGVDEETTMLITFPTTTPSALSNRTSHAVAMTAFRVATDPDNRKSAGPSIQIQGTKGHIQIFGPAYCPERYRVIPSCGSGDVPSIQDVHMPVPGGARGMFWEADEVARCLRDGRLESETLPWDESIVIMEAMDTVRQQGGLTYPEILESTTYPLDF
ncbi:Gfo/Idh/MocA family protein [Aspergillus stella-maris]|uniref:Gfo/Idh/MocA family protein n=1 Tax=Aspergillus stella-maris TaxID=1810926 RepID=UPI003CCD4D3C